MHLRIAIANIQAGVGVTRGYRGYLTDGWRYALPHDSRGATAAGRFLREAGADIGLLTEVDGGSRRSRGASQLDLVAAESGLAHTAFFPTHAPVAERMARTNEGNAVLARFPVLERTAHALRSGAIPRTLGETILDVSGIRIRACVAHLALGARTRAAQVLELAARVTANDGPFMLGGDFNERDHAAFGVLEDAGLQRVTLAGFPSWKPLHELQVLFLSEHFTVKGASAPAEAPFSDHLPLLVDAELRS